MSVHDDRIKHLEFIQAAINRQATNSFTIKGWSITVSSALYVYTASHLSWWLAVISVLPAIGFAFLDVYYLRLERLFRHLYDDVARGRNDVPFFSLDIRPYRDGDRYPYCRRREVWKSPSVYLLYGTTFLVGLALLVVALFQDLSAKEVAQCIRDAF